MLGQHQGTKPEKAQLWTFEIMHVQYDCNPRSNFTDLLRKRSVCQNIQIGHRTEPKVGQCSRTAQNHSISHVTLRIELR